MADAKSAKPRKNKGTYYCHQPVIREVPGVAVRREARCNVYSGTAAAMVAAGIATLDMFPGQPGRAAASTTFRPSWTTKLGGEYWWNVPGYMAINRNANGTTFRIELTVDRDEQARRNRRSAIEEQERKARLEAERLFLDAQRRREAERDRLQRSESWPFPDIERSRFDALERYAKIEIQDAVMDLLDLFEERRTDAADSNDAAAATMRARGHLRLAWAAPSTAS